MPDSRVVWQIGGGPSDRSYADMFIRWGVGLVGPGDPGPWNADRDDSDFETSAVRYFASETQVGDAVVLRRGQSEVVAIGLVASGYEYYEQFDDVNGWDLQHGRRIRWSTLPKPHLFSTSVFGGNPRRFSRVQNEEVCDFVVRYINSEPRDWQFAPLPTLPHPEPPLEPVPDHLAGIIGLARDLHGLYWDEVRFGELPRESEVLAAVVFPFLRAQGWPTECIAVEWRDIDITLFARLPRTTENCKFIVEVKRLDQGVEGWLEQGIGYATKLGIKSDIVLTDGIRYRLYRADRHYAPSAYANLVSLKKPAQELFDRLRFSTSD